MALEIGKRVGDYEVVSFLGAGGMGQVYSARSIISGRIEAMKVLLPDFAAEPDLAARFTAEIRTLAGLDHPNIAQLRTAFEFENQLVMIMEFVEGITLEKRAAESPIPIHDVLAYSGQVLSALSYAHASGVTHRDIKPANIMITSHGVIKLMDFGIAKSTNDLQLTRPGTTMGSVYYMSPEQVRGGTVDARSDLYSFGVTLYEMLTGRRPFQAQTAFSVLSAQLNDAPQPPSGINPALSPELNNIVLRAMVKSPDGRFQTADEFRAALRGVQEQNVQATASAPQFAPVAVPVATTASAPPPPPILGSAAAPKSGHRGLWLGVGAAMAIIAMIAAATLLPRMLATHADQKTIASAAPVGDTVMPQSPTSRSPQPVLQDASSTPVVDPLAGPMPTAPRGQPHTPPPANPHSSPRASVPASGDNAPAAAEALPGPSKQEISQARERMIQLEAKADAAKAGIQQIRSQQQAQGFDMRGDILAAMNRMTAYLNAANRALDQNDLETANQNMERAEKELSTLETFLGR